MHAYYHFHGVSCPSLHGWEGFSAMSHIILFILHTLTWKVITLETFLAYALVIGYLEGHRGERSQRVKTLIHNTYHITMHGLGHADWTFGRVDLVQE